MTHVARRMYVSLEPLHGQIYFVPEAGEEYEAIGVDAFPMGYFASRSAAMGAVSAGVVAATFFNFNPSLVASAIPAAWDRAAPAALIEARFRAVDRALRRLLGDDATGSDVVEAAELARRAAEGCTAHGRPLYAGHAELDWPDEPLLVLWHAVTLLREFRGDGHIAALVDAEIDGCEALVTHAAMGDGLLSRRVLQMTRAWSDDEWSAAEGAPPRAQTARRRGCAHGRGPRPPPGGRGPHRRACCGTVGSPRRRRL